MQRLYAYASTSADINPRLQALSLPSPAKLRHKAWLISTPAVDDQVK